MTCQRVIDFLSEYLERSLPWQQRVGCWVHLGLCRDCRNYAASFCYTLRLAQATARDIKPDLPVISRKVTQAILAARK